MIFAKRELYLCEIKIQKIYILFRRHKKLVIVSVSITTEAYMFYYGMKKRNSEFLKNFNK